MKIKIMSMFTSLLMVTSLVTIIPDISLTSTAADTPIHTFKTKETVKTGQSASAANKVINNGLTTWSTAFADGSSSYSITEPFGNDLFDPKEIDGAKFVIKTKSDNFNGSLGFGCGESYDWGQIDFKTEDGMGERNDMVEEGDIEEDESYLYEDEYYNVEITPDEDGWIFTFELFGYHDQDLFGSTKGAEIRFALNGMNAICTEPVKNGTKFDWTELSTEAQLVSFELLNEAKETIFDAADPDAHKLPPVENSGKWTDHNDGSYSYAWGGAGQAVNLADDKNASIDVTIPEVDKAKVKSLKAKVTKTGAYAEGQLGINATGDTWTSGSTATADEDGIVTVSLPNGINDDKVTLQMFWCDHGTTLTVSDLEFVLSDGSEVPFVEVVHVHRYTKTVSKKQTCTESGLYVYTCSCGDSYTEEIPATGHKYGEWIVTRKATRTVPGEKKRYCKYCGKSETSEISIEDAPIYSMSTVEQTKVNQSKSRANIVAEKGVYWSSKFKDNNNAYTLSNPFVNDLLDPSKLDSAKIVIKTKSNNFNGSLGFVVGDEYYWDQADFNLELDYYFDDEIFGYNSNDTSFEVTKELAENSTYTYTITLNNMNQLNINQKSGEVKFQINGMNAICTVPTDDPDNAGKFTWTEHETDLDIMEFKLYDKYSNEIFDGANPEKHKPQYDNNGKWTDNGDGSYTYVNSTKGVEKVEGLDKDPNAKLLIPIPADINKKAVSDIFATVEFEGADGDGSMGISGGNEACTYKSVDFSNNEDGRIHLSFKKSDGSPLGISSDELTIQAYWIYHGTKMTIKDIEYVTHEYTSRVTKEPTCTTPGIMTYTCTCGDIYTEEIPSIGHNYSDEWTIDKAATCSTTGRKSHHCINCDDMIDVIVIPELSHNFGEWTISKSANCTESGLRIRNCLNCGFSESETIPASEHNFSEWITITEPKCTEPGVKLRTCSVCQKAEVMKIDATEHSYGMWSITKYPTCQEYGELSKKCSSCGRIESQLIEKTAHTYKKYTTKATLTKNGSIVEKCSVCGAKKPNSTTTVIYYPKTIALVKTNYVYNGKVQRPTVTVKDANGKAIPASNHTVTYPSGCNNVGKYTIKVTFKGNYSGAKTFTYTIIPKGTAISRLTAAKKGFTATWAKNTTQTTGYQIQYTTDAKFKSGVKTVTINRNTVVSKAITNLLAGRKYYARVRTYRTVNKVNYFSAWSGAKAVVTKK